MLRPFSAIVDELVHAEIRLRQVREDRAQAVALLVDADGRLERAKARTTGLRAELEAHITEQVSYRKGVSHAA